MKNGASTIAEFEAGIKGQKAIKNPQLQAMALPMTQEPFFTELQEPNTQDLDLNLSSLFDARSLTSIFKAQWQTNNYKCVFARV